MGNRLAIIIGINSYADREMELEGCVTDAGAFEEFFRSPRGGDFGDIVPLLNGNATLKNLCGWLDWAAHREWEQFHIFFSGHGSEEGIVLYDGVLLYEELRTRLQSIAPKRTLFIVDACLSGELIAEYTVGGVPKRRDPEAARAYLRKLQQAVPGVRIITATDRKHLALERGGRGVFSFALLWATEQTDTVSGSVVFLNSVFDLASKALEKAGYSRPQAFGSLSDYPFVVAPVRTGHPATSSQPTSGPVQQSSSGPIWGLVGVGLLAAAGMIYAGKRASEWDPNVGRYRDSRGRFKR